MAYKPETSFGLGFTVEIFDPEMEGKYIGRYKKVNKRKKGEGYSPGWLIWPTVNGKRYHEFFMDKLYNDSPAESLVAAIKRRNEVLSWRDENPIPFSENLIASNASGRNGVSFAKTRYKKGKHGQAVVHQSACWCATWTDILENGQKKTVCKKFSVKKYGFWQAYRLAIHARWSWENSVREQLGKPKESSFGITKAPWMLEKGAATPTNGKSQPAAADASDLEQILNESTIEELIGDGETTS